MTTLTPDTKRTAREAFDSAAADYDAVFGSDPVTIRLRTRLHTVIRSLVRPGSSVLDLGCGTGTDVLALAALGYRVTGIDNSGRMLEQARAGTPDDVAHVPMFMEGTLEQAGSLLRDQYDLVYSNFGALNCVEDLRGLSATVAPLVRPGGYFVPVVMPPVSPWEVMSGLVHLRPGHAFRRFGASPTAMVAGIAPFPIWYHSLPQVHGAFSDAFTLQRAEGWNIITPPPAASALYRRFPRTLSVLTRLESSVSSLPGIRSTGDHIMVVLRRMDRLNS